LLFGDESEALTHPYLAHAWAKRGCDLRVEAPGQSKKRAMIGTLDYAARKLIVNTSATKRSGDFITLLGRLDAIYGPCPGRHDKPVVFVLDNGPIHISKASRAALAARDWLTIEWLPKYAPELNAIERSWRDFETPLPRASDLHRYRSSRPRYPSGYCRHEPRAPITPVYQSANRCLAALM
jgi:DDE superfamily endonuclease